MYLISQGQFGRKGCMDLFSESYQYVLGHLKFDNIIPLSHFTNVMFDPNLLPIYFLSYLDEVPEFLQSRSQDTGSSCSKC